MYYESRFLIMVMQIYTDYHFQKNILNKFNFSVMYLNISFSLLQIDTSCNNLQPKCNKFNLTKYTSLEIYPWVKWEIV
jgi:hypothetical protein